MSSAAGRNRLATRYTRLLLAGVAAAVIGYAAATHWAVASGHAGALGLALALAPVLVGLLWLAAATRRSPWVKLAAAGTALGLALLAASHATAALGWLYPLPSILVYGALLWMFGRTLMPGREALVTHLARHVHGALPDEITAYTRQVTWVWCVFFGAMALTSLLLFAFAPLSAWSLFVNVLSLPLIAVMFVAEYVYRVLRHPRFPHASLLTAVRVFHELGRGGVSPGRGS
jgi:uncharacterized membrane protein